SKQGLNSRVTGQASTSNQAQQDRVASQSPLPGQRVNRGTVVNLTVFRFAQAPAGTQPAAGGVTAPSVVNQPYPQAGQMLSQVRLNVRVAGYRETRDPALNNRVAAQVPAAGAQVSVGSTVEVTLYEVRLASISALYRGKGGDVVGPGSQATPDGKMDGHFSLTFDTGGVPRVVKYLLLEAVDARGNRIFAAGGWDTSPGGTNRILGVYRSNRRLNPRDQAISDPVQGRVAYEVYGHDSGYFRPGQNFRLTVEFTDRGKASAFARVGSR
ncbi:MAG: PASTA domain-containing protein, partial [Candidatus Tectomicrobia bacterium]|nr:PASTA domain-containing protein [Candidatus Tectomicrobia bacterium]